MKKNDKDIARKRYFRNKERQADLLNAVMRQLSEAHESWDEADKLYAENFTDLGTEFYTVTEHQDGKYSRSRTTDVSSLVTDGRFQCCFMLENQELTDYKMTERILNCESIWYHEMVNEFRRLHKERKDWFDREEKLCGFLKDDKLIPVISLVLYYGFEEWKGSTNLKQVLRLEGLPKGLEMLINDYRIHVIDVCRFAHLEWLRTDLHETFGFIRYAAQPEKLRRFVSENEEAFAHLSKDAYDFIAFQTGTRKLEMFKKECMREDGDCNMCKAIDEMEKMAERRGEIRGEKRGEEKLAKLMELLLQDNRVQELQRVAGNAAYRSQLYSQYGL